MSVASINLFIATRDRSALLQDTLADVARAIDRAGVPVRVYLADDGSVDATAAVLRRHSELPWLHCVGTGGIGKGAALNQLRALAAPADLEVFTDDDVVLPADWLALHRGMADSAPGHAIFCGPIQLVFPLCPSPLADLRLQRYWTSLFAWFQPQASAGSLTRTPFGANWSVRADMARDYQFDPAYGPGLDAQLMGEETELLSRLQLAGARIHFDPLCSVGHRIRPDQLTTAWAQARIHRDAYAHYRQRYAGRSAPGLAFEWSAQQLKRARNRFRHAQAQKRGVDAPDLLLSVLKVAAAEGRIAAIDFHRERRRLRVG